MAQGSSIWGHGYHEGFDDGEHQGHREGFADGAKTGSVATAAAAALVMGGVLVFRKVRGRWATKSAAADLLEAPTAAEQQDEHSAEAPAGTPMAPPHVEH